MPPLGPRHHPGGLSRASILRASLENVSTPGLLLRQRRVSYHHRSRSVFCPGWPLGIFFVAPLKINFSLVLDRAVNSLDYSLSFYDFCARVIRFSAFERTCKQLC